MYIYIYVYCLGLKIVLYTGVGEVTKKHFKLFTEGEGQIYATILQVRLFNFHAV